MSPTIWTGRGRDAGVEIDRHLQRLGAGEDGIEHGIVEEAAVRGARHQGAAKSELLDGALEFVGGGGRRGEGKVGEPGVAAGIGGDACG